MAATPTFTSAPRIGVAAVSTANTNRDGTGTIVDVLTGVAAGTRVERIVLQATGDPADSVVTLFLYNGTTSFLFDEVDIGNPAAASTVLPGYRNEKAYADLILPTASWKLQAAITVALTAGVVNVFAFAGDLT
jgi:hypothetical protein